NIKNDTENLDLTLFVSILPTDAEFLHIKESIAIQVGDDSLYPIADYPVDLAGNPRIVHGKIDVGAYEYQGTLPVELLRYEAKLQDNKTILSWATSWEKDGSHYIIERGSSLDDFKFLKK